MRNEAERGRMRNEIMIWENSEFVLRMPPGPLEGTFLRYSESIFSGRSCHLHSFASSYGQSKCMRLLKNAFNLMKLTRLYFEWIGEFLKSQMSKLWYFYHWHIDNIFRQSLKFFTRQETVMINLMKSIHSFWAGKL